MAVTINWFTVFIDAMVQGEGVVYRGMSRKAVYGRLRAARRESQFQQDLGVSFRSPTPTARHYEQRQQRYIRIDI